MDSKIIIYLLAKLKKDYEEGHIYREDTIKSCIYYHLKQHYGDRTNKYIYTEVRNVNKGNGRQKFDLVISRESLHNDENVSDIAGYDSIECIIEIKYILGTLNNIKKSLLTDIQKLDELKDIKNISRNIFFIWEHTETSNEDLEDLKIFLDEQKGRQLHIFGLLFSYKKGENEKVDDWYYINNQEKEIFTKKLR